MSQLLDSATGLLSLPTWLAATAAVLLMVLGALALRPLRTATLAAVLGAVVAFVGFAAGLALIERNHDAAERRTLDARAAELSARSLAPGSPLACLDDGAGEAVETACEKAVFAHPETVAAAVSYVAARVDLLAATTRFASRDRAYAGTVSQLRRPLELDRFGIVAHVLSQRDGCTADSCAAFALLQDTSAVKANIKARAYDEYVARHATEWTAPASQPAAPPVAQNEPGAKPREVETPTAALMPPAEAPTHAPKVPFDYPSAASIPPVSIMNAEPPVSASAGAAPAEAAQAKAQAAKKGGQSQTPTPATR
ncbi:MAG TPA: hypothetical protein VFB45_06225 [Pseudolabrys sp.]|nr:hypothetical protein [Pseudolabrys sp.]